MNYTRDGRFIISVSEDGTVKICDIKMKHAALLKGHLLTPRSMIVSPDNLFALSIGDDRNMIKWDLEWEYEFPGWTDWDEGARPYLEIFLSKNLQWSDADFEQVLLPELQLRGYGWLNKEKVKLKLLETFRGDQQPVNEIDEEIEIIQGIEKKIDERHEIISNNNEIQNMNTAVRKKRISRYKGIVEEIPEDERLVDRQSMIDAFRGIGTSEEKLAALDPQPLSQEEQLIKRDEIRQLFKARKYRKVVSNGVLLADKNALSGDIKKEVYFDIGFSAIQTADTINVKRFAYFTGLYARFFFQGTIAEKPDIIAYTCNIMDLGEKLAPGCMYECANFLYPEVRENWGESHEYTLHIKKYI